MKNYFVISFLVTCNKYQYNGKGTTLCLANHQQQNCEHSNLSLWKYIDVIAKKNLMAPFYGWSSTAS